MFYARVVTNELSGLVDLEGQTLPTRRELSIRVVVKDQGVWRITAFTTRFSRVTAQPSAQRAGAR